MVHIWHTVSMTVFYAYIWQKDPEAGDLPGETGAGDADTIEVVEDAGAVADPAEEQDDGDKKEKEKTL